MNTVRPSVFGMLALFVVASCGDASPAPTAGLPTVDGTVDSAAAASTNSFTLSASPSQPLKPAVLRDVRVSSHADAGGWDPIVFEFDDALRASEIEYEEQAIACGSGERVRMLSTAVLVVRFSPAEVDHEGGGSTVEPLS